MKIFHKEHKDLFYIIVSLVYFVKNPCVLCGKKLFFWLSIKKEVGGDAVCQELALLG